MPGPACGYCQTGRGAATLQTMYVKTTDFPTLATGRGLHLLHLNLNYKAMRKRFRVVSLMDQYHPASTFRKSSLQQHPLLIITEWAL